MACGVHGIKEEVEVRAPRLPPENNISLDKTFGKFLTLFNKSLFT